MAIRSIVSPGSARRYAGGGRRLNVGRSTRGYSMSTSSGKSSTCQNAGQTAIARISQGRSRRSVSRKDRVIPDLPSSGALVRRGELVGIGPEKVFIAVVRVAADLVLEGA